MKLFRRLNYRALFKGVLAGVLTWAAGVVPAAVWVLIDDAPATDVSRYLAVLFWFAVFVAGVRAGGKARTGGVHGAWVGMLMGLGVLLLRGVLAPSSMDLLSVLSFQAMAMLIGTAGGTCGHNLALAARNRSARGQARLPNTP